MQVTFVVQGGAEEPEAYSARVNEQLRQLGQSTKDVSMTTCLHEKTIGDRARIPVILVTVMIIHEGAEQ